MKEKKIIKEDELEEVNGGKDMDKYLPKDHGRHIGKYEAEGYIGQKVYAVADIDREAYFWGTLLKSWEEPMPFGTSLRKHLIHVDGKNDYSFCFIHVGVDEQIMGDKYTLFLFK